MKKVVLLGDSLRLIGYGTKVPELLKNECEIWQPEENCRFAQHTFRGLWDWAENMKDVDLCHWNNGIWDVYNYYGDGVFTPIDQYVETMKRIAAVLQKRCKKIIFATTTPVLEGHPHVKNEDVVRYNEAIVPVLREMGIEINDLHSFVLPNVETFIRSDDYTHLTEEGINACAEFVSQVIRKAL